MKRLSITSKQFPVISKLHLLYTYHTDLCLFLLFFLISFLIRVYRLDVPKTYMFDEVYHAFTAVEMAKDNPAAWEWWNTPPEGFAYEWTHPPLSKLFMVLGIKIFGANSFGWRFFGSIFGGFSVGVLYLLARKLFKCRLFGAIAAYLFCFDFLNFSQSRIGMNDIYLLTFVLLGFLFFVYFWERYPVERGSSYKHLFLTGISLGLALASKWPAVYAIGTLGFLSGIKVLTANIGFKKKPFSILLRRSIFFEPLILFSLLFLIPLLIYFFSYLPFFLCPGHSLETFWELQKQMWWYHTRLEATHPYTSAWWTWPLVIRPVWFYVNYGEETLANVYAMGNPFSWWPAILSLVFVIWETVRKKEFKFILVLLGFFSFWLPWAISPRIMFIYHFLPSASFMLMGFSWVLFKIFREDKFLRYLIFLYLILVFLSFLYFYPHISAWPLPKAAAQKRFWFSSWR